MTKFRGRLDKIASNWRAAKNPFLRYGTGIQNYFNLQVLLIQLLFVICLLTVLQMSIYASMDGIGSKYQD